MDVKGKILLVDDDPKITAVSSYLEKLGFEILNASDGDNALKIIKSENPALVILDMEMPGLNGLQLLTILKKDHKDIKVFVFTAHGEEYKKKAEKIGFDKFFDKSVYELDSLLDAVRGVFGTERIVRKEEEKKTGKTPKAAILFIEPSVQMYAYTCGLFDNPNFCIGEYDKKIIYGDRDNIAGIILEELSEYKPDIVLINDYAMSEGDILNLIDLMKEIKIKPTEIIVHGLFERNPLFETQLKMKKIKRCIQNTLSHEQLIGMNMKLIDFVNQECVSYGLTKKT